MVSKLQRSISADFLGISASGLCMVHCALTPLLLSVAPGLMHYVPGSEMVHRILALIVLSCGSLAIVRGYQIHRKAIVLCGFLVGLALVLAGTVAGEVFSSHLAEMYVTVCGSTCTVISHWKNRAFCVACGRCEHEEIGAERRIGLM